MFIFLFSQEHAIHEWGDKTVDFHETLIRLYKNCIVEDSGCDSSADSSPQHNKSDNSFEMINHNEESKSQFYPQIDSQELHRDLIFDLSSIRKKLLQFLHSSKLYKPAKVLLLFDVKHSCLLASRAVVLCRLGQHKNALEIYINELKDLRAALRYCHLYYSNDGAASQVYLLLLELLIQCEDVNVLLVPRDRDISLSSTFRDSVDGGRAVGVGEIFPGDKIFSDTTNVEQKRDKFEMLLDLLKTYSKHIRLKPVSKLYHELDLLYTFCI